MTNQQQTDTKRRTFIKKLWIGLGVLALAEITYLISGFLFPKRKQSKSDSADFIEIGNINDFKINTVTPFRNHKFFLSRLKDGGVIALSIKCSHLGCNIIWESKSNSFICPCHSSWFNKMGDVMQSPATRPLAVHPVLIEKNIVKVNTSVVVKRNSIEDTVVSYPKKKGGRV